MDMLRGFYGNPWRSGDVNRLISRDTLDHSLQHQPWSIKGKYYLKNYFKLKWKT